MDVLDWIEKAKQYRTELLLSSFAEDIVQDEHAVDVQRAQWSQTGTSSKGETIGFYKKSTEEMTMGLKKEGEPYNLRNTGDLWEKTYLNAVIAGKDLEFEYNSSGIHKEELFNTIKKHGAITDPEDIFGLYEDAPFVDILEPKFVKQLEDYYHV